ncbi:hypothetical protein SOVF_085880 [Spinacia oleracea]|nr:uncharacterized protein LOC110779614 isoform X2 [Spinacia oleracea]XP_021839795.1 uncharacterized protein LOC110779614 isoform X2 [Spinacia oleracea]KNA16805.1 hypothetical protein SOVF_085880 [Spinacia oleracea]
MVRDKSKKKDELAANSSQGSIPEKKTPKALKLSRRRSMKRKFLKSKKAEDASASRSEVTNEDKNKTTGRVGNESNLNTGDNGKEKGSPKGNKKKRNRNKRHGQKRIEAPNSDSKVASQSQAKSEDKMKTTGKVGNESNTNTSDYGKEKVSPAGNKRKNNRNKNHEQKRVEAPDSESKVGGLIFMCSAKTKPDCFRYKVMALPSSQKEVVLAIKPGLKLFLYDFDLRLLYGIFEASSAGGMKLEPDAFAGSFSAQVRFRIFKDCLPLPESAFRNALKESYDQRTRKFKTELTTKQVQKLRSLFRAVPQPHLEDHPRGLQPASSSDLLFVTEKDYRSYGLRPELRGLRQDTVSYVPVLEPCSTNQEREHVFRSPAPIYNTPTTQEQVFRVPYRDVISTQEMFAKPTPVYMDTPSTSEQIFRIPAPSYRDITSQEMFAKPATVYGPFSSLQDPAVGPEPYFLSENEYRMYGLRGRNDSIPATTTRPSDSYQENQYHSQNYNVTSSDPFTSLTAVGGSTYGAYSQSTVSEAYRGDPRHANYTVDYHLPRRVSDEGLYSSYASRDLSAYNQRSHIGGQSELASAPVSSRYSFSGASYALR